MSDQTKAADSAEQGRNEVRSMLGRVVAWTLANQLNAKHAMDQATLARMGANLDLIPPSAFGNTNINISQPPVTTAGTNPLWKAAAVGLGALGLGAGGLVLGSLLGSATPVKPPASISTPATDTDIPLIIDWSWQDGGNPDAGSPTTTDPREE